MLVQSPGPPWNDVKDVPHVTRQSWILPRVRSKKGDQMRSNQDTLLLGLRSASTEAVDKIPTSYDNGRDK